MNANSMQRRPLRLFFSAIAFLTAFVMILNACKKQETAAEELPAEGSTIEQKFFAGSGKTDPTIAAIAKSITAQNERYHFINKDLTRRFGYPRWDAALIGANSPVVSSAAGDNGSNVIKYVYIPFARDSEQYINSSLTVKIQGTDTAYQMLFASRYTDFGFDSSGSNWKARDVFNLFLAMEYRSFKHRQFTVMDGRILGHEKEDKLSVTLEDNPSSLMAVSLCQVINSCGYNYGTAEAAAQKNSGSETSKSLGYIPCIITSICTNYEVGSNGDPGSGGGGGGTNTNPPNWWTNTPCGGVAMTGLNQGTEPCETPGWIPAVPNTDFQFSGLSADDANAINNWRINNIKDSLDSCRKIILNALLSQTDNALGKILAKMEKATNSPLNIEKFKVTYRMGNLSGAVAQKDSGGNYNVTTQTYTTTITVDSNSMKTATDIEVASALVHETIHAYMTAIFFRLTSGVSIRQLERMGYDSLFDNLVSEINAHRANPIPYNSNDYQHNYMADKLLDLIASAVKEYDNNSINDYSYYWCLAWGGLRYTKTLLQAWPNANDTPVVKRWPPANPATSFDSTRGLRYALTINRLDSIRRIYAYEYSGFTNAKGKHPKPPGQGCY